MATDVVVVLPTIIKTHRAPKITVTSVKSAPTQPQPPSQLPTPSAYNNKLQNKATTATINVQSKSPDTLSPLVPKKSYTSMTDDEIIAQNLKEILEKKSREERKANGRLVAVILASLVIFLAVYHAWIRKTAALAGMLIPAVIMLSYGAWVVILARRDKHKRALFQRHIEEVALKHKCELQEKLMQMKQQQQQHSSDQNSVGNPETTLQFVNELSMAPPGGGKHRAKSSRQKRQRQFRENRGHGGGGVVDAGEVIVHTSSGSGGSKRPSIRQKLFGQTIAHVKLVEMAHGDIEEAPPPNMHAHAHAQSSSSSSSSTVGGGERSQRLQRMDTLTMPQLVRMGSAP